MILVKDVQALRRRAAGFAGRWFTAGREVFNDERERVALVRDPGTAAYLADIHNAFLPLSNAWLMTRKALRDRAALTKLLAKESGK